jgi:hypothetical protein
VHLNGGKRVRTDAAGWSAQPRVQLTLRAQCSRIPTSGSVWNTACVREGDTSSNKDQQLRVREVDLSRMRCVPGKPCLPASSQKVGGVTGVTTHDDGTRTPAPRRKPSALPSVAECRVAGLPADPHRLLFNQLAQLEERCSIPSGMPPAP